MNVSDTPKVTDTLIELFKIDMETQKDNPQGNASLAGAEFTWKYYAGFYNKDNLPAEATRTWVTKTIAETDSDGTTHYITKLADAYKVSGDSFYMQDGKAVLPLGTLTVEETKAPNGYLLDGAYMQAGDKSKQIKGLYVTQITEDGDLAVLSGSNQFSVSDKVIRGGVKIQKRDLETGDTKPQGSATLKDTAFDIISLNDNAVLVEGKLYKKNEVVKTIRTDIEGIASTSSDLLPCLLYTSCLSADVNAAFDPTYASAYEANNCSYINNGVIISKYTGHGGKYDLSLIHIYVRTKTNYDNILCFAFWRWHGNCRKVS